MNSPYDAPFLYILPVPCFFSQNHGQGGHVSHVRGILDGFRRAGYAPVILTSEPAEGLAENEAHVLPCPSRRLRDRLPWSFRLVDYAARLSKQIAFRFAYIRYAAGFALLLPRLKLQLGRLPLILEVNSLGSQRHTMLKGIDRRALEAADVIICVSDVLAEFVRALIPPNKHHRILVLPNGVDAVQFVSAEPEPELFPPVGQHIGYCGVLKPGYGLENLLDAFHELYRRRPAVELHIFGDGPHRAALEQRAVGKSGVIFHGMATHARIPRILKSFDVLVGTTSAAHRFQSPIKLYEYMASGRPIVYARTPQTEEVLGHGVRGLLYAVGDAHELESQLELLLTDRPLAEQLAQTAQLEAVNSHSWDSRITNLLAAIPRTAVSDNVAGPLALPDAHDDVPQLWDWYLNLEREIQAGLFDVNDVDYLQSYYQEAGLLDPRRRTFFKRHYVATFAEAANFLLAERTSPRILDLGCGTGTQSLYLALRGARILAVDCDAAAVKIFRKRIAFYQQQAGRTLDIEISESDCFAAHYAHVAPLDGVYSMFAFNMMQPSARLLAALLPHLSANCRWAVIDGNNLSWRARLLPQWRRQVWSPPEFRQVLEAEGLRVCTQHGGIVLPPALWRALPERLWARFDRMLCNNWLLPVSHQILAERQEAPLTLASRPKSRRRRQPGPTEVTA
jgi:glycosyltransferase involved in cell wall biosynthesis/SAM-dependent methyltransferase